MPGKTKEGRKRVTFTVDTEQFKEMIQALDEAGVPRSVLGAMMDDVFKGLAINFKEIARAKREGRQLSFGELLGVHVGAVVDEAIEEQKKKA